MSSTTKAISWPDGIQQGGLAPLFHCLMGSIPAGNLILRVSYGCHDHSYTIVNTYQLQLRNVSFLSFFPLSLEKVSLR
jgi:hypothetical protein